MGLTQKLGTIPLAVFTDSSNNVGIGGAANASFKLQVTGTTNLVGALSGTSATFTNGSGAFIAITATTTDATGSARLRVTSTGGNINDFSSFSSSHPSRANQAWIGGDGNSTTTILQAGGVEFLRGTSTGAATFSSNVTATSISTSAPANGTGLYLGWGSSTSNFNGINFQGAFATDMYFGRAVSSDDLVIRSSGGERVRFTASGLIGIGTSSPDNLLHLAATQGTLKIASNSTSGANIPSLTFFHAGNDEFKIVGGGYLAFLASGTTERMRITSAGNVGIGTSSPTGKLHLKASTSSDIVLRFEQQNDITSQYYFNIDSAVNGTLSLITNYLGGAVTGFTQDRSGRVGIGTSSPTARLSIQGTGTYNSTSFGPTATVNIRSNEFTNDTWNSVLNIALIRQSLTTGSSSYGGIGFTTIDDSNAAEITDAARIAITNDNPSSTTSPTSMSFWTNTGGTAGNVATERMRITSGGQLQIKQSGNTFNDGLRLFNTGNIYWGFVAGGDTNLYLGYNSPSTSIGVFSSSTGAYTATSDINKKKDFEQSGIGLDAILGLKPTLYRMKSEDKNTEKHLGFIAQEVKEFIPQAYSESINGDNTFIGLTEMPIIAALVKAVQQLKAEKDAEIAELRSQIEELKALIAAK